VSKASSETTMLDDQLLSDEQNIDKAIIGSLEDVAPEQRVDTEAGRSVTERERTVTRAYSKKQVNKKGKGKAKK
jgi:hypothetical protein